jgi:uncharacterized protein with GYD domain
MAKYLFEARYTAEGVKGLVREGGTERRAALARACVSAGGKLDAMYFAFGSVDAYVIVDMPDNSTAAALALAVNQGGTATTNTIVLMTPEEVDAAGKKTIAYSPPRKD